MTSSSPVEHKAQNPIRLGDVVPDFTLESQLGPITLHKYIEGKWAVFFSHPADFTPVCTSELSRVAELKDEWEKRNVAVLALSVDSVADHIKWIADIEDIRKVKFNFPLLADSDRKVSLLYNMLNQEHLNDKGLPLNVRAVFFIGDDKKLKASILYPAPTGRNFDEILRVIDSLQLAVKHKVATPVDWKKGDKCYVLPSVSTEDAIKMFPKGVEVVRPWLRITPDPSQ